MTECSLRILLTLFGRLGSVSARLAHDPIRNYVYISPGLRHLGFQLKLIGSFSIDDDNGRRRLFQFAENGKRRRISLELISLGPHPSLEREKEIRRQLFTSSIKLAIRHFHVVMAQGR